MKKIPQRTCLGCMQSKNKSELVRIVKQNDGKIFVDKTGKANGRGAYICPHVDCFNKAVKTKGISRALKMEIPEKIYAKISEELM